MNGNAGTGNGRGGTREHSLETVSGKTPRVEYLPPELGRGSSGSAGVERRRRSAMKKRDKGGKEDKRGPAILNSSLSAAERARCF